MIIQEDALELKCTLMASSLMIFKLLSFQKVLTPDSIIFFFQVIVLPVVGTWGMFSRGSDLILLPMNDIVSTVSVYRFLIPLKIRADKVGLYWGMEIPNLCFLHCPPFPIS
jgi:hypothetical protein